MNSKLIALGLVGVLLAGTLHAQESLERDKDGIYRFQPGLKGATMELVPPAEVKTGLAYNYYQPQLGRHVWGFAQADGTFRYAFGEGTVVPTDRLDLRISKQLMEQLLERGMPGLTKRLEMTGGSPAVQLLKDDDWELMPTKSSLRVFDLLTGHRWEWHGKNRKAVLHTYGDQWQAIDGRYYPATGPAYIVGGNCCSSVRAGSAVLVMRTPE